MENTAHEGSFRADLYHRLNVFRVVLPPLHDALDELVPLLVAEFKAKAGQQTKEIPSEVRQQLKAYLSPADKQKNSGKSVNPNFV